MGTRGKHHRVPILRPGRMYVTAGLLLIFTFGTMLAAIHDSFVAADWTWFLIFIAGAALSVVVYFWVVACWLRWITPKHDYMHVYISVDSVHEFDHHTGEN
jgi:hypothetical protein